MFGLFPMMEKIKTGKVGIVSLRITVYLMLSKRSKTSCVLRAKLGATTKLGIISIKNTEPASKPKK